MAEREELLTQSLGAGDPATVECRRIRILWKMDLGAGPTGTEKRLGEQKARGKEARAALVAGRRQMDTTR